MGSFEEPPFQFLDPLSLLAVTCLLMNTLRRNFLKLRYLDF